VGWLPVGVFLVVAALQAQRWEAYLHQVEDLDGEVVRR